MDDFGPSRRRGWIHAGRETLPALPRALEVVVWDQFFGRFHKFRLRVWILEGPFGAVMVDLGPSRPRQSAREGPIALATTHESSGAHLGPIF